MGFRRWIRCLRSAVRNISLIFRKSRPGPRLKSCFPAAASYSKELTGQPISDHFMHDTFDRIGDHACLEDVVPSKEEIAKRCQEAAGTSWRPVLV